MIKAQQVESPIEIIQDPAVLSLEIQSPNVRGWAVGVSNHLQNAKYLGSMLPFSVSVIGSLGCKSNHERQVLTGLNLRWWNFATKMPPWLPSSNNFRQICKSFVESILTSPTKTIKNSTVSNQHIYIQLLSKKHAHSTYRSFSPQTMASCQLLRGLCHHPQKISLLQGSANRSWTCETAKRICRWAVLSRNVCLGGPN